MSVQKQLYCPVAQGDLDQMRLLIAQGADVNHRGGDPDGETLLARAVTENQLEVVRLLIEEGANVNSAGRLSGLTPLMLARDNPAIMSELIAAGAELNVRRPPREISSAVSGRRIYQGGETALHLAAAANNVEAVKILIQAGADVEARDDGGCGPLDVALRAGSITEAAIKLAEAGARLTPQRLEAMHSGAHPAHSNLCFFPETRELPPPRTKSNNRSGNVHRYSTDNPEKKPREFTCPSCGGLIYSRKARLCGKCGATLSPEVLLTEDQGQIIDEQRKWARDLANALCTLNRGVRPNDCVPTRADDSTGVTNSWPGQLLRRLSSAEKFQHRGRPDFYLYLLRYGLLLVAFAYALTAAGGISLATLLIGAGLLVFACYLAWLRANPVCPNCKQNIRVCTPVYCHVCGKPLVGRQCANCSVDHSWASCVAPYAKTGNFRAIIHCPNCGVWLDSKITRRQGGVP